MTTRTTKVQLPHIYRPRDYQRDFFKALHSGKYRMFVKVWHRRAGKDMTDWNAAIELTAEQPMSCKYAFPTSDMARDNLWESYTNDGLRFTDFVPLELRRRRHSNDDGLNDSLKRIDLLSGGSIRVISAHKPGRLRGGNSKLFVLSEFQSMDPSVIDIIEPIVEANGGTILVNMTANGDSSAKGMWEAWQRDPTVWTSSLSAEDTPVFTREQLDRIRRGTVERFIARGQSEEEAHAFVDQEYYCSWDSPVAGSYFGAGMRRAADEGRITKVPYDAALPVNTYWDLGMDDSMTIWLAQLHNSEVRLIDYYESSGEGLQHYVQVLRGQHEGLEHFSQYVYGKHYAPHDIEVREIGTGVSRKEAAKSLGINFETVKRPHQKADGIAAIRTILSRCYFDAERCQRGINALKSYHKEWNDKLMIYADRGVHDWSSHAVDGFQTLALSDPRPDTGQTAGRIIRTATPRANGPATIVGPDGKLMLNIQPRGGHAQRRYPR